MAVLLASLAASLVLWAYWLGQRWSLLTFATIYLVLVATFGHTASSRWLHSGPLTPDRVWLAAIAVAAVARWRAGELKVPEWSGCDLIMLTLLVWVTASAAPWLSSPPVEDQPSTWMHLINGYWIPALIYLAVRCDRWTEQSAARSATIVVVYGSYLIWTSIFESFGVWSLVWPPYIADPLEGIHFGRARGPMLQSVRLGVCLLYAAAATAALLLWEGRAGRPGRFCGATLLAGFFLAIGLTFTRSVWLATIACGLLASHLWLPGRMRWLGPAVAVAAAAILVGVWGVDLAAMKREATVAETRQSTAMRASFAYVSAQMIRERPVTGFGFNQFQRFNPPYLDQPGTDLDLASIRGYVHHNTWLGLAVDTGIVGLVLASAGLMGWGQRAWRCATARGAPYWVRSHGAISLMLLLTTAIQMAFHEVTFTPLEPTLLLLPLAISESLYRRHFFRSRVGDRTPGEWLGCSSDRLAID